MNSPIRRIDMGLPEVLHKIECALGATGPALPAAFAFRWGGFSFEGRLDGGAGGHRVTIRGTLGHLPYSAENAEARRAARLLMDQAVAETVGGRYRVGRDGRVSFETVTKFAAPLSAERILQVLAVSLLHIRPCLKRFEGLLATRCLRG